MIGTTLGGGHAEGAAGSGHRDRPSSAVPGIGCTYRLWRSDVSAKADRNGAARRFQRAPEPPLRAGLVGLGYWGPNLLRGLVEQPGVDVSYLCDLDEERLSVVSRRYPQAIPTTAYEDLLEDPALDAILIATPVFTHFELAANALNAGKHAFVEKPLAPSAAEAGELIELAESRDVRLMCGQT